MHTYFASFKLTIDKGTNLRIDSSEISWRRNVKPSTPRTPVWIGPDESFSACLVVMDDNHRIPEWLAYHYYALPLRHVVIAVDPASHQNPPRIPNKWHQLMNITIWRDEDYVPSNVVLTRQPNDTADQKREKRYQRQGFLYYECSKYLKRLNKTWTTYHDIDEYLTISEDFFSPNNTRFKTREEFIISTSPIPNRTAFMSQQGFVLRLLRTYLNEQHNISSVHDDLSKRCIHVPRAKYGAIESPRELTQKAVPSYINADRLDTLRYRFRTTKRTLHRDGLAKGILDLSRIPISEMGKGGLVHRPLPDICPKKSTYWSYGHVPLGIQHYLGSYDSFYFRDDANNIRKKWEYWAYGKDGGEDDEIRPWIRGFCHSVGESMAVELLDGAGVVPKKIDKKNDQNINASST
ncbi:hypothetical protein ACHAXS_000987 [Conticribra weissflogii]